MFSKRLHPDMPSKRNGRRRRRRRAGPATAGAGAAVVLTGVTFGAGALTPPAAAPLTIPPRPVLAWSTPNLTSSPPPVAYASEAYDADNSTVVLFGGRTAAGTLSDTTWVWNGSTWKTPNTAEPPPRELASMAFDPTLHRLILFGGQGADGSLLDDTWAWNGASWVQPMSTGPNPGSPADTNPSPREAASFAYDHSGDLLLFGGTGYQPGTTPTTTTSTTSPPTSSPTTTSPNTSQPTTGQSISSQSTTLTETTLGDTWRWTAGGWVPVTSTGPSARSGATLAYDSINGTDVLFGGESTPASTTEPTPLADTWVWNGSKWTQVKPSTSPPARFGAVSDDDPPAGGPLLVCGQGASGDLADAWVWWGTDWIQATVQGSRPSRGGSAGAFDASTANLVVFGGVGGGGGTLGDTGLIGLVPPHTTPTTIRAVTTTTGPRPTSTTGPGHTHTGTTSLPKARTTPTTVADQTPPPTAVVPAPVTGALVVETKSSTVHRGANLHLSGSGFAPGSKVQLTFHSNPSPLGSATADGLGRFAKVVSVPVRAAAGEHHIVASGVTPTGATLQLTTNVFVLLPHRAAISAATTWFLVGLALLIPVAAWLAMAGLGWLRRRRHSPT